MPVSEYPRQNTFNSNDPFMDLYNQLPEQYRAQIDPYMSYSYTPGWKDAIYGFLGMRTGADAYREQMQAQARQMLASLQNDVFQNNYNSAQSQAQREHAAGLNPDLTGTGDADPAAQMEQPIQPIGADFLTPPSNFGSDFMGFIRSAVGIAEGVGSFGNAIAGLVGKELTNTSSAIDIADNVLSGIDLSLIYDKDTFENDDVPTNLNAAVKKAVTMDMRHLTPMSRKYIMRAIDRKFSDPANVADYWSNRRKAAEERTEALSQEKAYGKPYDAAETAIQRNSNMLVKYRADGLKKQQLYMKKYYELLSIQTDNESELARFARDNKLPENLGKAELAQALSDQAQAVATKARFEFERNWLEDHQKIVRDKSLPEEDRKAAQLLIDAYISGSYTPFKQTGFGFNGSYGDMSFGFNRNRQRNLTPLQFNEDW